ncbi:hypothetical protein, partial [Burkholderia multivorans]|uniref:hypothetical protein n=1 Tax=Burkholderia multivorans TaxID=87883 RepID=UPI001EE648E2
RKPRARRAPDVASVDRYAGIGVPGFPCGRTGRRAAAATGCRLVTVQRSLGSENAHVLRVRCVGRDDFGISSITLIYAQIVIRRA